MASYKLRKQGVSISLSQKEYVAEGGEGTIFAKGGAAYKICFPGKMMPEGKIAELAVLDKPFILNPTDVLLDSRGTAVGYTMAFVPQSDCYCLPAIFTNTFKTREHLSDDRVLKLIEFMKNGVEYIHQKNILLVDLNEFNFLVNKKFDTIYFIDVNSYQTRSYKATAIMDSIRDRKNKVFSTLTDWYSFAIVSFEMLIGIHPFRGGNHPSYTQGSLDDKMDSRMKRNVSVLNPQTRFPKNAVRPFTIIPSAYLDWYKKIFEQGERLPPPDSFVYQVVLVTPHTASLLSNVLNIKEIFATKDAIASIYFIGGKRLITTAKHVYLDDKESVKCVPDKNVFLQGNEFFSVAVDNKQLVLYNVSRQLPVKLKNNLAAKQVCVIDNRIYCQVTDKIIELTFVKDMVMSYAVAQTMEHSTYFGNGYITQNIAGAVYFVLLPESRRSLQVRIKELDHQQIISGKMVGNTAFLFTKNAGSTISKHKIVFDGSDYKIFTENQVDIYDEQVIILDNGLLIQTDKEGNLVASKGHSQKKISDDFLSGEAYLLTNNGSVVTVVKENKVYEISMK
jgi:hypothetical protein